MPTTIRAIEKLPVEMLRQIFVLGEKMHRGPRAVELPHVGFQDSIVQVCRLWRDIAVATPELWTYIYISRPPPHPYAELYISRSGTLPLHIDFDTRAPSTKPARSLDDRQQAIQALETMTLVEQYGGNIDRWRSLIVHSESPLVVLAMVKLVTASPTPALQFLSLAWEANTNVAADQEGLLLEESIPLNFPYLAHGPERPRLRHVEAIGLTNFFVFGMQSPRVSNLTTFTFACPPTWSLPSHQQFSLLLSASPHLESLSIDMGSVDPKYFPFQLKPSQIASLQVHLPLLRSFSLSTAHLRKWCLQLLQMIDAPEVEYFSINTGSKFGISTPSSEGLYEYLARGRVDGVLQSDASIPDDISGAGPVFPLLKHLNVEPMMGVPDEIPAVLRIFPMVTDVTLGGHGILALSNQPDLVPNASHFTYIDDGSSALALAGFSRSRAVQRAISTLVVCTGRPRRVYEELGLVYKGDELGREGHYHLPGLVDHLTVRQVDRKPVNRKDDDDGVLTESNKDAYTDLVPEPDTDESAPTGELGEDEEQIGSSNGDQGTAGRVWGFPWISLTHGIFSFMKMAFRYL
ncbi:unnamed protein product [Rhizoctonia solani]|uniref:F-box domain-containing protein n=1 Tax=Rhizoctonia solani TaxID=456999 RepID=A0A8H3DKT0_9AGAM|nr:unnamed protein product [Rhizoctonia solani]